jgi:hypothetical protein
MNKELDKLLMNLGEKFGDKISVTGRNYIEVDLGKQAENLGYTTLKEKYHDVYAIVPLKKEVDGMKVRIDGRTFVKYAQFESGIAVPGYVKTDTNLPHKDFIPNDSMILNF